MTTTQAPPTTMRAVVADGFGAPDVLRETTVDRPVPGPTEILVEVHAAGVNPVDWKSRAAGGFGQWGDPVIVGWDVSGVVVETGPGATLYAVGDEVYGMPRFPRQAGAYAEYVAAPSRHFAPKPAGLTHVQAAALPLVGLTAWQGLVEVAGVGAGSRVLIHGAGGGLGHVAVQVAKARGAWVAATASAGKHAWLRSLGVDQAIDYRAEDFAGAVSDLDVVFNTIGDAYDAGSLQALRDGGTLVSIPGDGPSDATVAAASARGIATGWTLVEPDRHGLLALRELVDAGALRPEIAATFPLAEAGAAHALGEEGHTAGKIVLEVR